MNILLTGHLGYIGSVMTGLLKERGHHVTGLDSGLFDACRFGPSADGPDAEIRKDIRQVTVEDLAGMDAVIHLAALSNDPLGELAGTLTDEINHRASVRLAQLCRDAGVARYIYSSSCSMYGIAGGDRPLTEDDPLNPLTAYARSKVETEQEVRALACHDFHPVFMRNATVYGVSPRLRLDLVVNNLTAAALATGRVSVLSDGTPWRPLIHVRDFCRAFIAVLESPVEVIHNQAFNVGRDEDNHRVRDIAQLVAAAISGSRVEILNQAGPDERSYRVDFGKIRRMVPAFQPEWTLKKGIDELVEAFRAEGIGSDDMSGSRYFRLRWIKQLLAEKTIDGNLYCMMAGGEAIQPVI